MAGIASDIRAERLAGRRAAASWGYDLAIAAAILAITALHYTTGVHAHQLHDIYRRLYYLPIILAAFHRGLRGGLIAAVFVCAIYFPHAFLPSVLGRMAHDPATPTQKVLEMFLYLVVGGLTGFLVSRLQGTQRALETTAGELRESLDHLRSAEEQLVQSARLAAVGHLSAGLAHEIRNPLASIKGSAEILADDFPAEHPKRRLLQVLIDESVRLNGVLSRFLAFARPRPLERRLFELEDELRTVVQMMQDRDDTRSIRFHLHSCGTPTVRIYADREQLRQVLLNVLLNAAQASAPAGQVAVSCARADGVCHVRVHDSGPGFSPDALANLFTPFFTTKTEGTGLGLALSHRIIEAHGGTITGANDPAGGGIVEISLPIEERNQGGKA
ncbi:MAG: ATP-binding protein [Candidatus Eisenbacteria bacterium]